MISFNIVFPETFKIFNIDVFPNNIDCPDIVIELLIETLFNKDIFETFNKLFKILYPDIVISPLIIVLPDIFNELLIFKLPNIVGPLTNKSLLIIVLDNTDEPDTFKFELIEALIFIIF